MNRRAFLSTLTAASAGLALDPERLLWRPGVRTFFLPSLVTPVALTDHFIVHWSMLEEGRWSDWPDADWPDALKRRRVLEQAIGVECRREGPTINIVAPYY